MKKLRAMTVCAVTLLLCVCLLFPAVPPAKAQLGTCWGCSLELSNCFLCNLQYQGYKRCELPACWMCVLYEECGGPRPPFLMTVSGKAQSLKPPDIPDEVVWELSRVNPRLAATVATFNRKERTIATGATVHWRPVQFSADDAVYWLERRDDQKRFEQRLQRQVNRLSRRGDKTVVAYKITPDVSEGEFSYRIEVKNPTPDEAFPAYKLRFTANEAVSLALEGGRAVRWSYAGIEYEFPQR